MRKVGLLCMFVLLLGVFMVNGEISQAATAEYGVVSKIDGEASFQKGATSRKIGLKSLDKVQAGDIIYTTKGSSIVLQLSTGDEISISEKSQVYFTEQGKHVYVHVLKGNVYVSAADRESKEEALYILSGKEKFNVLGTQFFVGIDPNTRLPFINVTAGVVSASTIAGQSEQNIYPGQGYEPSNQGVMPIDIGSLVEQTSGSIIEAILRNREKANEENEEFLKEISDGKVPGFPYIDDESMEQYEKNLKALLQKVINETSNSDRVAQEDIQRIIDEAGFKLDKEIADQYEGVITDREREMQERKQSIREKLREDMREREEQKRREREALQNRNKDLLDEIRNRQSNLEQERNEQKKKAEEQARARYERETAPPSRPRPEPEPDPSLNPIKFTATIDEYLFIDLLEEVEGDPDNYNVVVKINGNQKEIMDWNEERRATIDISDLTEVILKIEVFADFGEGEGSYLKLLNILAHDVPGFEMLEVNSNSAILYLIPQGFDDEVYIELYEEGKENPEEINGQPGQFLIRNLAAKTSYTVKLIVDNEVINEHSFDTLSESDLNNDHEEGKLTWGTLEGNAESKYKVYVNEVFVKEIENNSISYEELGESEFELKDIQVDEFNNRDQKVKSYKGTFLIDRITD